MSAELLETRRITSVDQLLQHLEEATSDVNTLMKHMQSGTVDQLRDQLIDTFIYEVLMIPLMRDAAGLPPVDDIDDVASVVDQIVTAISQYTDCPHADVDRRANRSAKQFPIARIGNTTYLHTSYSLH